MKIYPAIDIRDGRCVRLLQGKADKETVYFDEPADAARLWKDAGAEWVHVVDLDGAFSGEPKNWKAIEAIAATGLRIEMGGGVRSAEIVERALAAGVSRLVLGTRACESLDFVAGLAGSHGAAIAVGIDAKGGKVAVRGWVDTTEKIAIDLAKAVAGLGVGTVIYTDIATDGMLTGPNFEEQENMLRAVREATPPGRPFTRVIASGGVARREDVLTFAGLAHRHANLEGVIVGKALYDKKVDLADLISLTRT